MAASETTKVAPLGIADSWDDARLSTGAASGDTGGGGTSFSSRVRSAPVFGSNTLPAAEVSFARSPKHIPFLCVPQSSILVQHALERAAL